MIFEKQEAKATATSAADGSPQPNMKSRREGLLSASFSELEEPKPLVRGGIDLFFLVIVAILLVFGAVMAFSASSVYASQKFGDSAHYFKRHLLYILLACGMSVPFVLFAKPRFWRMFSVLSYGASLILLALVLVIGVSEGEAKRWIYIGDISVQPSEIAKLALVMMLALYMAHYAKRITSPKNFWEDILFGVLIPGAIMSSVLGLVALEHHISGLLILAAIGVLVIFLGGTRLRWLGILTALVAAAGVLLVIFSSYAQTRVNIWLHIDSVSALDEAWQTLQGLYAIGSGGIFGVGLGNSVQKSGYVSEPQNDFIFTIICEELGFVGAALLILLFALLLWRGFKIASGCPDRFMSLVAYGLTFKVGLQAVFNIAVVTNSMPNTGISLPFFSSGGSALALQIFEMGIILAISRYSNTEKDAGGTTRWEKDSE